MNKGFKNVVDNVDEFINFVVDFRSLFFVIVVSLTIIAKSFICILRRSKGKSSKI